MHPILEHCYSIWQYIPWVKNLSSNHSVVAKSLTMKGQPAFTALNSSPLSVFFFFCKIYPDHLLVLYFKKCFASQKIEHNDEKTVSEDQELLDKRMRCMIHPTSYQTLNVAVEILLRFRGPTKKAECHLLCSRTNLPRNFQPQAVLFAPLRPFTAATPFDQILLRLATV